VASVQSSPGGLPWWGVGERRESPRRSFCSDSGVRRRDSVRLLGLAGAVVDGRWGAGEGQGAFKKGWPGISACARGKEIPGDLAGRFGRGCVEPGREGERRS